MTAAPSTGPAAGIVTAAGISTGNLASSEPGMDEPADYNIPDAPDPAGGLLTFRSMHHDQPIAGHHHDLLKVAGQHYPPSLQQDLSYTLDSFKVL